MTGGVAVILGKTGRNFGAGMSGGIAFVYKLRGDMINADVMAAGELHLRELGSTEEAQLKSLLEEHLAETGSLLAERLLADWTNTLQHFTMVLPRDYSNVLEIRAQAVADGLDPDGDVTWQRILEVTNG
jgi:glutamate synthase (NADPH/NADH) large chain